MDHIKITLLENGNVYLAGGFVDGEFTFDAAIHHYTHVSRDDYFEQDYNTLREFWRKVILTFPKTRAEHSRSSKPTSRWRFWQLGR